jgi:hypothetical protein
VQIVPIQTPHFSFDGRGPILRRWIHDRDLLLPDSSEGFAAQPGQACGAVHDTYADGPGGRHFVVFHGLQVLQVVPEEVHAYWHRRLLSSTRGIGVFRVERSDWLASFAQRHLAGHDHFVLEWYDDIVEVICRDLIFGEGDFEISRVLPDEPRLGYAYFRHAVAQEKLGNVVAAIDSWERYLACAPHVGSIDYARRSLAALRARGPVA